MIKRPTNLSVICHLAISKGGYTPLTTVMSIPILLGRMFGPDIFYVKTKRVLLIEYGGGIDVRLYLPSAWGKSLIEST